MITQAIAPPRALLSNDTIQETLVTGLAGRFNKNKVLVLIPDHTRTIPLPQLFRYLVEILHDTRQLDFMVALGTHPPLSEAQLCNLAGISIEERATTFKHISLLNHAWKSPADLTSLGIMEQDEIKQLAGLYWHDSLPNTINIRLNKAVLAYDHIIIAGPTFPHEVAGFSGGAKYLFPGISGAEIINATHWLGALAGVMGTIGIKETPVRAMIHAAAQRVKTPITLLALTVQGHDLAGLFIGDIHEAWSAAADLSARRHILRHDRQFQQVLSCAPPMYDELWTAAKAMYKLEPVVADGGELIIYAPHLDTVSRVHGQYIYKTGYHLLDYFLQQWDQFKHIPLGVLAHSTHVRGAGRFENGVEFPRINVTLATRMPPQTCARLALGYRNPDEINPSHWQDREDEGILYVPKAGEMLYRMQNK